MSRRLASITLDNLDDLPPKCRRCVFWELDPVSQARAIEVGDPALEKEAWISSVLLEWGSCGKIVYVDGVPAGYLTYAPPSYAPRSVAFPTSPVSADAVLLMTAHVMSEFAGGGLGRMLVQGLAKDLTRRGIKAIEAFGDNKWTQPSCVVISMAWKYRSTTRRAPTRSWLRSPSRTAAARCRASAGSRLRRSRARTV